MKRFIIALAAVALALTACNKPQEGGKESKMETPVRKDFHASVKLTRSDNVALAIDEGKVPETVKLTSGGEFLLGFNKAKTAKPEFKAGKFDVVLLKAGAHVKFVFPGYGSLEVEDTDANPWTVTYTDEDGNTYTTTAQKDADKLNGSVADNLCRSWKPEAITVAASGDGIPDKMKVGKKFNTASIREIAQYLKDEGGLNIKVDEFAKYEIESLAVTEDGAIIFNFKDYAIAPFVGSCDLLNKTEDNLTYDFSVSYEDNPVIPVKGVATVTVKGGKLTFYTESKITAGGKQYDATVSVNFSELK